MSAYLNSTTQIVGVKTQTFPSPTLVGSRHPRAWEPSGDPTPVNSGVPAAPLPLSRCGGGAGDGRRDGQGRQPRLSPPTTLQRELPRAALPPQPRFPAPASERARPAPGPGRFLLAAAAS